MKTMECGCSFLSHITGIPNKSFEGKDKKCEHYQDGDCEILTEEITSYKPK